MLNYSVAELRNKKYWNQVNLYGTLEDDFIQSLIRHSYSEVVKKLKKKEKLEHPLIPQYYSL